MATGLYKCQNFNLFHAMTQLPTAPISLRKKLKNLQWLERTNWLSKNKIFNCFEIFFSSSSLCEASSHGIQLAKNLKLSMSLSCTEKNSEQKAKTWIQKSRNKFLLSFWVSFGSFLLSRLRLSSVIEEKTFISSRKKIRVTWFE